MKEGEPTNTIHTSDTPENLMKVQSEEALATLAGEMAQQGHHQPDTVSGGGAFAELIDE